MALTNQEAAALRAIIAREGGFDAAEGLLRDLVIKDKKSAALAALGSSVTVAVSDWTAPAQYVAQASNAVLPSVIADIGAAWAAKDQSKLGALFVQLYAASKAHLGL